MICLSNDGCDWLEDLKFQIIGSGMMKLFTTVDEDYGKKILLDLSFESFGRVEIGFSYSTRWFIHNEVNGVVSFVKGQLWPDHQEQYPSSANRVALLLFSIIHGSRVFWIFPNEDSSAYWFDIFEILKKQKKWISQLTNALSDTLGLKSHEIYA